MQCLVFGSVEDFGDEVAWYGQLIMNRRMQDVHSCERTTNPDQRLASDAEKNCPVSRVLNATITLDAKLM